MAKLTEIRQTIQVSWRTIKLMWSIEKKLFILWSASFFLPAVIPFINIYIYKLIIDLVIVTVQQASVDLTQFYPLIGARLITYFLQDASFTIQSFAERLFWNKTPMVLNQIFLRKIANLEMQYFESSTFQNLMEKAQGAVNSRPQALLENILLACQSAIQMLIALVVVARLNWFLLLLISLVAIPEFISQAERSKLTWTIWEDNTTLRKRYANLAHYLQSHWFIKEIKLFSLIEHFLSQINDIFAKFVVDNKKLATKNFGFDIIFKGLSTLIYVGVEVFVILQVLMKKLTVGDIAFYTGVVSNFQNALGGLFSNLNQIFGHTLYVKSIYEVMDLDPVVKIDKHPFKLQLRKPPVIEFKDITFAYPETKTKILDNFSLTIQPGEKIAFVGENGAGKTTVIKLLARFYDVQKGEIFINGKNIKKLDLHSWYKHLGVLFQDFNNYENLVKHNIHYGNVDRQMKLGEIKRAAQLAGASSMIEKFDKKYEQMLGRIFEGGIELSGGQWQKIALSRAFYRNAPILVLDEPTASIDAKAEAEIFNRVEKLSKGKTVIIISHRFSTVRNADKIYVIDKGKITEAGTHEKLMKLNGQYATMFNLQAKGYR